MVMLLPFDYNNTNTGNNYDTSNYRFTCPVAGDYMVILCRFLEKDSEVMSSSATHNFKKIRT